MDLIYMGSRKRQDLLSRLGAWRPWERVEGEGRRGKGRGKKYIAQKMKTIQKTVLLDILRVFEADF